MTPAERLAEIEASIATGALRTVFRGPGVYEEVTWRSLADMQAAADALRRKIGTATRANTTRVMLDKGL